MFISLVVVGLMLTIKTFGLAPPGPTISPPLVYGTPEIFVTTASQNFDPYRLINKYRQTALIDEYVIFADSNETFTSYLLLYDPSVNDIVMQNLGKELYWTFLNSTGVMPSVTIANATFEETIVYTTSEGNIQYEATHIKPFVSVDTNPPYDMIFEVPAKSRVLTIRKTLIDFQSWGLMRWQLTDSPFVTWDEIREVAKVMEPWYKDDDVTTPVQPPPGPPAPAPGPGPQPVVPPDWELKPSMFERLDNPCLPDIFVLYLIASHKVTSHPHLYVNIPAYYFTDKEDVKHFMNLTGTFCPSEGEACGYPRQLLLTNDHLVALTDKGVYVSAPLRRSDKDVTAPHYKKPLLSFELKDPCEKFDQYISCFKKGRTPLAFDLIHSIRLFYTPVCNLYQTPFYEDRVILVIEHKTLPLPDPNIKPDLPPVRAVTVLYSSLPYKLWKALCIGQSIYKDGDIELSIVGLVGIFFNHQLRHFDLTIRVISEDKKNVEYRRFVLPDIVVTNNNAPDDVVVVEQNGPGYKQIGGQLGKGFQQKKFPLNFKVEQVVVHPNILDVYFLGTEMWIAESGLSLVYRAMGKMNDNSTIRRCNFNHPDRTFVCVNSKNTRLLVGRVGSNYSPFIVEIDSIPEIWKAAGPQGGYWTEGYAKLVMSQAQFTAAYSGRIVMWYLYDPVELRDFQKKLVADPGDCTAASDECPHCIDDLTKGTLREVSMTQSCHRLKMELKPDTPEPTPDAFFRLVTIESTRLAVKSDPTEAPMAVLFIEPRTIMLFEADLSSDHQEHSYFPSTSVGQTIKCHHNDTNPEMNCHLYIRHTKPVDRFLEGFHQILYAIQINPLPLVSTQSDVVVLQVANSNLVFIKLYGPDAKYDAKHVGWTHYFPGKFSVLLRGFPYDGEEEVMWGYSTVHVIKQTIHVLKMLDRTTKLPDPSKAQISYLIDMSTEYYRERQNEESWNKKEWDEYVDKLNETFKADEKRENRIFDRMKKIQEQFEKNVYTKDPTLKLFRQENVKEVKIFDPKDIFKKVEAAEGDLGTIKSAPPLGPKQNTSWSIEDGGCHHILELLPNPVLYSHGGRIHLDMHDSISLTVRIRPTTELGFLTMYRPMFVITNSNAAVLNVEKKVVNDKTNSVQTAVIMLTPTGTNMGVATLSIRVLMGSLQCKTPLSITLIVLVHRQEGRRLWINYPFPLCSVPVDITGWGRPFKKDPTYCIKHTTILEAGKMNESDSTVERNTLVMMMKLPKNYRPPSVRGEKIPLTPNTYHADPSVPKFHHWYLVTRETQRFKKCLLKKNRNDCGCSDADRLSDDPAFSDCKEMVFAVQRMKYFNISIDFEPMMRDEDQSKDFYAPSKYLSVYIEEVNGRESFTVISNTTAFLDAINKDKNLHKGKKYHDAHNISITLHGTGLFHFKVGLGRFDSFEEVTGYFMLYSQSNELNHIMLVVVMLLTITFCFSLIFLGFVRVRKRLSAQLPFQSEFKGKLKVA